MKPFLITVRTTTACATSSALGASRTAAARILRRVARKLTKPLALRWNAWQLEKSKDDVSHFESVRVYLANKEQQEALRQVRLLRRRNQIAGW